MTEARAIPYCQNCGTPIAKESPFVDATAQKVQDPEHPNKTLLGRVNVRHRCLNCRSRIIIFQRYYQNFEAAEEAVKAIYEEIAKVTSN